MSTTLHRQSVHVQTLILHVLELKSHIKDTNLPSYSQSSLLNVDDLLFFIIFFNETTAALFLFHTAMSC